MEARCPPKAIPICTAPVVFRLAAFLWQPPFAQVLPGHLQHKEYSRCVCSKFAAVAPAEGRPRKEFLRFLTEVHKVAPPALLV